MKCQRKIVSVVTVFVFVLALGISAIGALPPTPEPDPDPEPEPEPEPSVLVVTATPATYELAAGEASVEVTIKTDESVLTSTSPLSLTVTDAAEGDVPVQPDLIGGFTVVLPAGVYTVSLTKPDEAGVAEAIVTVTVKAALIIDDDDDADDDDADDDDDGGGGKGKGKGKSQAWHASDRARERANERSAVRKFAK
ncbi:MAG: hypothetical protein HN849_16240 [Victivallales bacterium]|jgi:hypothetical protein|nr:hypothetical protein [Victivallales bacterium]